MRSKPLLFELRKDWRIARQASRAWSAREALVDTFHYYRAKAHEKGDAFDEMFGTETSRIVGLEDLDGVGQHAGDAVHYWPTRQCEFSRMMETVGHLDYPDFVFLDLGCGKGRVVLLASGFPFKRVVGVDFSVALVERARKNLAYYSGPLRASDIEFVVADAAEYPVPHDNLLVYMFDPFGPRVLTKVLANLMSCARRGPHKVLVLYYAPPYQGLLLAAGFHVVARGQGRNWPFGVYSPI